MKPMLVDLILPDIPGLEIIPQLRALCPDMGIVVLTWMEDEAYRTTALEVGADAFVPKASMGTDLVPAIQRIARDRKGRGL